jgi:site-specific DNA recombinase
MKPAVLYARVSSREQQQEGYSIQSQLKTIHEYADRSGFSVSREFIEIESAKAPGRAVFDEMVIFLKRNRSVRIVLAEKTDRLYRNIEDAATIKKLDVSVHLIKESQIISRDSKSQDKLVHGLNLVLSCNYSDKLSEEVRKGMRQKMEEGTYPGRPPFGYRNNKGERTIEVHPENSRIATHVFIRYGSGAYSLAELSRVVRKETGKLISKTNLHKMLANKFYVGVCRFGDASYSGTQDQFIPPALFERVQSVLAGHNKPKYSKRDVAFRGLLTCANDGCALTGDVQKEKYVYYRCTGHRGKCSLPRFREESIAERLREPLKGLQVPPEVVSRIVAVLREDQRDAVRNVDAERSRLEVRLAGIRRRMDALYSDKLDGKIPEDFWERKMADFRMEEQQTKMSMQGLAQAQMGDRALDAQRIFELANKAESLYISQNSMEKAKLLRMIFSNFSVDPVSVKATYRKPFNLIFKRAHLEEWSGREDSNLRPPGPEPGALPDCATPRTLRNECRWSVRSMLLRRLG